jgi:hypothetical protein
MNTMRVFLHDLYRAFPLPLSASSRILMRLRVIVY